MQKGPFHIGKTREDYCQYGLIDLQNNFISQEKTEPDFN